MDPGRLPSDGVSFGSRGFLHEDILDLITVTHLCTAHPVLLFQRATHFHMIRRNSNVVTINMGRGAYDTTGTLKPGQPPPPKPR
ncbi:hypothetical protein E4T52_01058 [Aureobasidium sp. EXF-3400]|nr:hypothetical protein E4T51_07864 [Aureobasidium sp. EXF-12344]KAI4784039.1 hypothetical protein E4T52_01058 [Aureobasidium sp. EXF-3400]